MTDILLSQKHYRDCTIYPIIFEILWIITQMISYISLNVQIISLINAPTHVHYHLWVQNKEMDLNGIVQIKNKQWRKRYPVL